MPVYYRETVIEQPPPPGGPPQQLRPQFSSSTTTTTRTGTTMMSPSESTYIRTQSAQGSLPRDAFRHSYQRMPAGGGTARGDHRQFPVEVRVTSSKSGGGTGAGEGDEVSRRSERWSREEYYPEGEGDKYPYPGYHKVTKEDYVIEEVVEAPRVVQSGYGTPTTEGKYPQTTQQPQQYYAPRGQQPQQTAQQPPQFYTQKGAAPQQQPQKGQPQQYYAPRGQPQQQAAAQQSQYYGPRAQPQYYYEQQQYQGGGPPPTEQPQQQYPASRQQPPQVQPKPQQQHGQWAQQRQMVQPVQPHQYQQQMLKDVPPQQYSQQQRQYVQQQAPQHAPQERQQPEQTVQRRGEYVVQQQQQSGQQATQIKPPLKEGQQQVQAALKPEEEGEPQLRRKYAPSYIQQEQPQKEMEQPTIRGGQHAQAVPQQQYQQHQEGTNNVQYGQQTQQPKEAEAKRAIPGQQVQTVQQQPKQQLQQPQEKTNNVQYGQQPSQPRQMEQPEIREQQVQAVQYPKEQYREEEGEGGDDEPPPEMQLAQAPEELLMWKPEGGGRGRAEGAGSPSPTRHRQHIMVNSPWYRQHPEFQQQQPQQYQDFRNYAEPLYIQPTPPQDDGQPNQQSPHKYYYQHFQPQHRVHQYFSPSSVKWDSVYEDVYPDGCPPPFAHGPGSPYDYLAYHQKVNLDRRRAESEQRRHHHSPVPGAAEHGYQFGGMDFINHYQFDPKEDVGEPFDEREFRRDLHTGPPRRAGDFYGLDYTTMLPEGQLVPRGAEAKDAQYYHGYQSLPPRKNFRLCGWYTADPDAPLNITEAQGLDQLDSDHLVGDTLSNQRCMTDRELTEEEKRTFALLYGPGGFKPDHVTIRPEPKPEEAPVFSTTIGGPLQKTRSAERISPVAPAEGGYVNPMKVEGESWMLGRRQERPGGGHHGLTAAAGGDQPPFVRPARFPAHVPQWAKQRQQTMTRGAKSVDRHLFAPSWAKVPQPQPPYWVKRGGGGGAVGGWPQRQRKDGEEEGEEHQVRAVHGEQPKHQQKLQQEEPKEAENEEGQQKGKEPTQQQQPATTKMTGLVGQSAAQQQPRAQQQVERVPQQAPTPAQKPQQPQRTITTTRMTTVVGKTGTIGPPSNNSDQQQPPQQAQWQQQQIKRGEQQQQQKVAEKPKQQPQRQVQVVQQQFDRPQPATEKPFDRPGGMYYFRESNVAGGQQKVGQKQKSEEETSGLENLPMPKLGELPLPEAESRGTRGQPRSGGQKAGTRKDNEEEKARRISIEYQQKQWQQQPQDGDIFIDARGRPVQYVKETEVDPRTGETVVREEWRLMEPETPEGAEESRGQRNVMPSKSTVPSSRPIRH